MGSGGIPLIYSQLYAGRRWVLSTRVWPLYPRKRPVITCAGGWMIQRAGLDAHGNLAHTRIRSQDRPSCSSR